MTFSGAKRTVTAGPFPNPKDLMAGYWLIDVKSRDDAIEWAERVPFDADPKGEAQIEIRQLFELDDFAPSDAIEQQRELDKALARKKK